MHDPRNVGSGKPPGVAADDGELFERYQRSEQALVGALAEMYIQYLNMDFLKELRKEELRKAA